MKGSLQILILLVLGWSNASFSQEFGWAKKLSGANEAYGRSVATDREGNVFTTGDFSGIADFDPGQDSFNLAASGKHDIFISALDASGNFMWAKQIGSTGWDQGMCIATDDSGNVYVTGYFEETADFDPGEGVLIMGSAGLTDIFILKLNAVGDFIWAKRIGSDGEDRGLAIAIDQDGSVYTTGYFGSWVDFDPGDEVYTLKNLTSDDGFFIVKLNRDGKFGWAKNMKGDYASSKGNTVKTDQNGFVYVAGAFRGVLDYDTLSETHTFSTNSDLDDVFIMKLNNDGDLVWGKQMGGRDAHDRAYSIALDTDGNIYSTGTFGRTGDFNPGEGLDTLISLGSSDIFVSKLDANGDFVWVKQIGGADEDMGTSIAISSTGNCYITGIFERKADFDPGEVNYTLTSSGDFDGFILKLNNDGNFNWAYPFGSYYDDEVNSVTTGESGTIYYTGAFMKSTDFDPGPAEHILTSGDYWDVFVLKLYDNPIGIKEIDHHPDGFVYPNPSDGHINIRFPNPGVNQIRLLNLTGQILFVETRYVQGTYPLEIKQPSGMYLLEINDGEIVRQMKVVKR